MIYFNHVFMQDNICANQIFLVDVDVNSQASLDVFYVLKLTTNTRVTPIFKA